MSYSTLSTVVERRQDLSQVAEPLPTIKNKKMLPERYNNFTCTDWQVYRRNKIVPNREAFAFQAQ